LWREGILLCSLFLFWAPSAVGLHTAHCFFGGVPVVVRHSPPGVWLVYGPNFGLFACFFLSPLPFFFLFLGSSIWADMVPFSFSPVISLLHLRIKTYGLPFVTPAKPAEQWAFYSQGCWGVAPLCEFASFSRLFGVRGVPRAGTLFSLVPGMCSAGFV